MGAVDYNQIFDGISLALHNAYPTAMVHGGTVKQDLNPGDFNVVPITASESAQIGTRSRRSVTFDVIYYPPEIGSREACLEKQHELPDVIGTITTPNGDIIHCLQFDATIEEDAMHCIVSYPHFVYRPTGGDVMDEYVITEQ